MIPTDASPPVEASRWRRPALAALAAVCLFVVYVGLSFLNDPDGTLSTDVGGKTATLQVMREGGSATPEVGYWAAPWDPDGALHGLIYTQRIGDHYVNVTTVPVLELARPLFDVGGYRAALAWSMVGGVATAFAARALALRAGASRERSWLAFWLAGLASPVVLYALDLWEHSPGLALMSWGVVAAVDAMAETVARRRAGWLGLCSGLAFGAAFSMRTEAAAYAFAVVGVSCLVIWRRRGLLSAALVGGAASVGFVLVALGNQLLEIALLGGSIRSGRTADTASAAGADVAMRVKEALVTAFGLYPDLNPSVVLVAIAACALLAITVRQSSRSGTTMARLAMLGAVAVFFMRAADGLGFVPGLLAVAPWGVAGLVLVLDPRATRAARDAVLLAACALPVVWTFQYSGGALPQWGGRYVLTSGLVFAAIGVGSSFLLERWLTVSLSALSVAVAAFGLATMSYRTHQVGEAARAVSALDVPVVSVEPFWLRELGMEYREDTEWLSVSGAAEIPAATHVLDQAGRDQFELLWLAAGTDSSPPAVDGWRIVGPDRREDWLDVDFRLTRYVRDPSNVRS